MRALLYLVFFLSSVSHGLSECRLLFAHLDQTTKREKLGPELERVGGDENKAQALLDSFGDDVIGSIDTFDGLAAKFFTAKQSGGKQNMGFYFFSRNGDARVAKLFPKGTSEIDLKSFAKSLEGASLGEQLGAPKVYRFGKANQGTQSYYYIEMEAVNGGYPTPTIKNPPSGKIEAKWIPQMAKLYADAVIAGIRPEDPDWAINPSGRISWIDTHSWGRNDWRNTLRPPFQQGATGRALVLYLSALSEKANPKEFLFQILKEIKANKQLTLAEKDLLVAELFHPSLESRYRSMLGSFGVSVLPHESGVRALRGVYQQIQP